MICGCRASMSPSRGAAPRISATSATRSRFWLSSEISRPPRCSACRKRSKAVTALSGSSASREAGDQRGNEFDKGVARRFHPEHAIVADHPLLHGLRHHDRLLEAERGQMFEQARIVRTGAVIGRRQFRGAGRIALEQLAVMPLHDVEMAEQIAGEGGAAVIAEKAREALHRLDVVGQRMGLLVRDHLQPVFDPPQEFDRPRSARRAPRR